MPSISDQKASFIPPEIPGHCFSCAMTVPGSISFSSQEHPQPAAILWSCSLKYPSRPQFSLNIWMTWVKCIRWEEKQRDRGREIKGAAHYRREIEKQQTHTHACMHAGTHWKCQRLASHKAGMFLSSPIAKSKVYRESNKNRSCRILVQAY